MLSSISQTPPEIAFLLGFFVCQGLKRSKVNELIDLWLPSEKSESSGQQPVTIVNEHDGSGKRD